MAKHHSYRQAYSSINLYFSNRLQLLVEIEWLHIIRHYCERSKCRRRSRLRLWREAPSLRAMLSEAKHREAPSYIGVWKKNTDFLSISFRKNVINEKSLIFIPKIYFLCEPARPGLTVTLFDALYLTTYYAYGYKFLTQCLQTV